MLPRREKYRLKSPGELVAEARELKAPVATNHVKIAARQIPWKEGKMLSLTCPNCGKVFFRTKDLARTVIKCPACHTFITFNKQGKCVIIKQVEYARPRVHRLRRMRIL